MSNTQKETFFVHVCTDRQEKPGQIHYDITPNGDWDEGMPEIVEPFFAYIRDLLWSILPGHIVLISLPFDADRKREDKWRKTRNRIFRKKYPIENVFYGNAKADAFVAACKKYDDIWCDIKAYETVNVNMNLYPEKSAFIVTEHLPRKLWDATMQVLSEDRIPIYTREILARKIDFCMKQPLLKNPSDASIVELYRSNACRTLEVSFDIDHARVAFDLWHDLYEVETFHRKLEEAASAAGLALEYHEYNPNTQRYECVKRIEAEETTQ